MIATSSPTASRAASCISTRAGSEFSPATIDTFERAGIEKAGASRSDKDKTRNRAKARAELVNRFRAKASKARPGAEPPQNAGEDDAGRDRRRIAGAAIQIPEPPLRSRPPLMRLEDVSVGYGNTPVLHGLENLRIDDDDRIALLGANGNGKSTLPKLLSGRLEPMHGHKYHHKKLKVGYFAQHELDELNPKNRPRSRAYAASPTRPKQQMRAQSGAIGFPPGDRASPRPRSFPAASTRVAAGARGVGCAASLILDEPTNHLDMGKPRGFARRAQ